MYRSNASTRWASDASLSLVPTATATGASSHDVSVTRLSLDGNDETGDVESAVAAVATSWATSTDATIVGKNSPNARAKALIRIRWIAMVVFLQTLFVGAL
jgi:hypothetical protein